MKTKSTDQTGHSLDLPGDVLTLRPVRTTNAPAEQVADLPIDLPRSLYGLSGGDAAEANEPENAPWTAVVATLARIRVAVSRMCEGNIERLARIDASGDRIERQLEDNWVRLRSITFTQQHVG